MMRLKAKMMNLLKKALMTLKRRKMKNLIFLVQV